VARYSYGQLEQLWINAGGAPSLAPVAAAIAEAESGGNPDAVNATDNGGTQTSWGLWQISNGTHAKPVPGILSPAVNAQQAVAKHQAGGWAPWGTYDSGAYAAFLSNSTPPDPSGVPASKGTAAGTPGGGTSCLIGPLPHTSWCLLDKSQARAIIGGALMAAGALTVFGAVVLIAAFTLNRTGLAQAAVKLAPGPAGAAARKVL
jgi:hypothetical protein